MPRIKDERLVPKIAASEATRAVMRAYADRLLIEGNMHINTLRATLDELIEDLEEGYGESIAFCALDVEAAIGRLLAVVNIGHQLHQQIAVLDPAYDAALAPARREVAIQKDLREIAKLDPTRFQMLVQLHNASCSDTSCSIHEALRRAMTRKGSS